MGNEPKFSFTNPNSVSDYLRNSGIDIPAVRMLMVENARAIAAACAKVESEGQKVSGVESLAWA